MIKIYRYRVYPTKQQQQSFQKIFGSCRFVYNWALTLKKADYEKQKAEKAEQIKSISIYDISKKLTALKAVPEYIWLNEVPAICLIWSLNHLDVAYKNFFRNIKKGQAGFPKFKNYNSRKTFSFHQGYEIGNNYVTIPKNGKLYTTFHRDFTGKKPYKKIFKNGKLIKVPNGDFNGSKTCTVIQESSGKYYISIVIHNKKVMPTAMQGNINKTIGIDVGVINSISLSNGYRLSMNIDFSKYEKRLLILQRKLSRKINKSSNFKKAKIKLAKVHEKIKLKRKYEVENIVCELIKYLKTQDYTNIALRNYDIKSMLDRDKVERDEHGKVLFGKRLIKTNLNRKLSSGAMGMLCEQIKYKLKQNRYNVFEFDANETKTTARCSDCKSEDVEIDLKSRKMTCNICNHVEDIDWNAAKNVCWFANENINSEHIRVS